MAIAPACLSASVPDAVIGAADIATTASTVTAVGTSFLGPALEAGPVPANFVAP